MSDTPQADAFRHPSQPSGPPTAYVFFLTAETRAALARRVAELREEQSQSSEQDLATLMLARGRLLNGGTHRLALVVTSLTDLGEKLEQASTLLRAPEQGKRLRPGIFLTSEAREGKIAFLFPGQGSQFSGMLSELAQQMPSVQCWFDRLDTAYDNAGLPLPSTVLHDETSAKLFDMQTGAQLGLVASLAMAEVLLTLGVAPDCMLGHSNGEHAALIASGAFGEMTADKACAELATISVLTAGLSTPARPEGMLAVGVLKRDILDGILSQQRDGLFLAIDNSPTQILLAGTAEALERAAADLKPPAALCSQLPFQRAHHTPLFADWAELLQKHLMMLELGPGSVPVYSAATTCVFPTEAATMREWMAQQWCTTVRFRETIERMYEDGVRIFLEVGPESKLTALVQDILRNRPRLALSASSSTRGEWVQLLHFCAELFVAGLDLKMEALDRCYVAPAAANIASSVADSFPAAERSARDLRSAKVDVATLIRAEHACTAAVIAAADSRIQMRIQAIHEQRIATSPLHVSQNSLSGELQRRSADGTFFRIQLSGAAQHPYLRDHAMGTRAWGGEKLQVLPFTYTLALSADAVTRATGRPCKSLRKIKAYSWLALDCGSLELDVQVKDQTIKVFALQDGESRLAFEAEASDVDRREDILAGNHASGAAQTQWTPAKFYAEYAFHGPAYQCIQDVRVVGEELEATLEVIRTVERGWPLDPALMDCAGQLVALWLLENGLSQPGVFPFAMESVEILAEPPAAGTRIFCRGHVTRSRFGTTSASFEFALPNGDLLWRLTKLEQKIVEFPEGITGSLFGKKDGAFVSKTSSTDEGITVGWLDKESIQFLESGNGLWSRVLAHGLFSPQELQAFYCVAPSLRPERLMKELVVREGLRRWRAMRADPPAVCSLGLNDLLVGAATGRPAQLIENFDRSTPGHRVLWQHELQGHRVILVQDAD